MKFKTVSIKQGYSVKELGGEFCIVKEGDTNNGSVLGLPSINETGIFLWGQMEKGVDSLDGLIQSVTDKYQQEKDEAEEDVLEFLAKLINGKIVDLVK